MTPRPYSWYVSTHLSPLPNWRWQRVEELVAGDPHNGRYVDDASTLRAVRFLRGDTTPALVDVRDAVGVYQTGGLWCSVVEAYLLTDLSESEVGWQTGLSGAAVSTYGDLFFAVRGDNQLARFHRADAVRPGDRLRSAAVQLGPLGVWAEAAWLAGGAGLSPELHEHFERRELMDRLHDKNPGAFLRAADRLRAIDEGLRPGVMYWPRSVRRVSKGPLTS